MKYLRSLLVLSILTLFNSHTLQANTDQLTHPTSFKITILSDMIADRHTHGEWGFAAHIRLRYNTKNVDFLFDTGGSTHSVIENAKQLGIDLTNTNTVILSHNHTDHTSGLLHLRKQFKSKNPKAFHQTILGAKEALYPRSFRHNYTYVKNDRTYPVNHLLALKDEYIKSGGSFISLKRKRVLSPGVWVTGKVHRLYNEKTTGPSDLRLHYPNGKVTHDSIPESQALVIETKDGPIVITGCGHAGIVNILSHISTARKKKQIFGIIGGIHLFQHKRKQLDWIAKHIKPFKVNFLLGSHCTGIDQMKYLAKQAQIKGQVSSVGIAYDSQKGILTPAISIVETIE